MTSQIDLFDLAESLRSANSQLSNLKGLIKNSFIRLEHMEKSAKSLERSIEKMTLYSLQQAGAVSHGS